MKRARAIRSPRMGDLAIRRNLATRTQVTEALAIQERSRPRPRLGVVLRDLVPFAEIELRRLLEFQDRERSRAFRPGPNLPRNVERPPSRRAGNRKNRRPPVDAGSPTGFLVAVFILLGGCLWSWIVADGPPRTTSRNKVEPTARRDATAFASSGRRASEVPPAPPAHTPAISLAEGTPPEADPDAPPPVSAAMVRADSAGDRIPTNPEATKPMIDTPPATTVVATSSRFDGDVRKVAGSSPPISPGGSGTRRGGGHAGPPLPLYAADAKIAGPPLREKLPVRSPGAPVVREIPSGLPFGGSGKPPGSLSVTVDHLKEGLYRDATGTVMPYRYHVPARIPAGVQLPLVLFLHGIGEAGSENRLQLSRHPECLALVQPEVQEKTPCFFVAPQHPAGERWGGGTLDEPSEMLRAAVAIVDRLVESHPAVDPDRLYVTGLSSGGVGAWEAVAKFPFKFAAAVPVSAGWDPQVLNRRQGVAVWAFFNEGDSEFHRAYGDAMLKAVVRIGGTARKTTYRARGHNAWSRAYREPDLIPWLFAQRRYRPR